MKVFVVVISYYFPMIVSQRQRVNWFVMLPDGLPHRVPIMQQFRGAATGMKAASTTLSTSSIQFTPAHTKWVWQQRVSIIGDLDWMFSVITKYATKHPQTATSPISNGTAWQDSHQTPHHCHLGDKVPLPRSCYCCISLFFQCYFCFYFIVTLVGGNLFCINALY